MPDQNNTTALELSLLEKQLDSDDLSPEQRQQLMRKISRLRVRIFLDGVRGGSDDS